MHTMPRLDLRALYLALTLLALADAALYTACRWWGVESLGANVAAISGAALLAAGLYRFMARNTRQAPAILSAPVAKKKRAAKNAPAPAQPRIDPAWLLRGGALVLAAVAVQLGMQHAVLPNPATPPWRAEAVSFAAAGMAAVLLLAWGARFWLQTLCRETPEPMTPRLQRLRDYLPPVLCFLSTGLMLWARVPDLFAGEMSSDLAQGLFWAAYDQAPRGFDGEGMAWLPKAVAALLQARAVPLEAVPRLYQLAACLTLGACASAFAWPVFRPLLRSDLARVLICAALACQPDYALKTLTHAGAYVAVVSLLAIWLVLFTDPPRYSRAIGAGVGVGALALCHPGGAAMVGALAVMLAVSLARRAWPRAAFCALAMTGPLVQVWALALVNRAGADGVADAGAQAALVAKIVAMLPLWGVGGKAALALPTADDGAYVVWLCAAGAAVACLVQTLAAPQRWRWLAPAGVAVLVAVAAVACHVLVAPEAAATFWGGSNLVGLAAPVWFVPCVAVFLALAVGIGGSTLNRHVPWALGLWLFAGYPFGLGQLPATPFWPTHGFSAWQGLAPKVLGQTPPRGCIPVDPFPAYLGMDCQLLHSVGSATGLGGWMTFFNEVPLTPPPLADGWSVDSIGLAFNKTPPLDAPPWDFPVTLVALDERDAELARVATVFHPPEIFTHFFFEPPLEHVKKLKLIVAPGTSLAMGIESQETREPFWVWFGRGQPEEGGEGVHLAEQ